MQKEQIAIGEVFKTARVAKGQTLRQVESSTGISNAYLSQLENGKITSPSMNVVTKLCTHYEINFGQVFTKEQYTDFDFYYAMLNSQAREKILDYAKFLVFVQNQPTVIK